MQQQSKSQKQKLKLQHNRHSPRERTDSRPHCQITDIPPPDSMISAPSAAPRDTYFLHRIIHDNLILYTHINCKDARDLDILVFCFVVFLGVFWVLVSFSMFLVLVFLVWGVFRFFKFFGGFCFGIFDFDFGFLFLFFFCLVLVFCDFVILIVVAYCTQLLSQAMYNLLMAAMAETCSC